MTVVDPGSGRKAIWDGLIRCGLTKMSILHIPAVEIQISKLENKYLCLINQQYIAVNIWENILEKIS